MMNHKPARIHIDIPNRIMAFPELRTRRRANKDLESAQSFLGAESLLSRFDEVISYMRAFISFSMTPSQNERIRPGLNPLSAAGLRRGGREQRFLRPSMKLGLRAPIPLEGPTFSNQDFIITELIRSKY